MARAPRSTRGVTARRLVGPTFFLGGVAWDYATLRIDGWPDNALLCLYFGLLLLVLGAEMRLEGTRWVPRWVEVRRAWLGPASQFLLGALLSAFGVHVLRAMYPGRVTLFVFLLAAFAVANEVSERARRGTAAKFAIVAFIGFQLASLVVPVFTGVLLPPAWAAALTALTVASLVLLVRAGPDPQGPDRAASLARGVASPLLAAFASVLALMALVHTGVVPALPLVLRRAVVAKGVTRTENGYDLEDPQELGTLGTLVRGDPEVAWEPGGQVSVFTTVFVPSGLGLALFHDWEWLDPDGSWLLVNQIPVEVRGGREQGFRTWTTKEHLRYGAWRVRVRTPHGQELGRVMFDVVPPRAGKGGA